MKEKSLKVRRGANFEPLHFSHEILPDSSNIKTISNTEDLIICELGRGATSKVYLVQNKQVEKNYALKQIQLNDTSLLQQLVNETFSLQVLRHPNIVQYHDAYFANGYLNIKMAYVDGCPLSQLLKKSPIVPEPILGNIAYFVLHGLLYLRNNCFLHRDLKPSNILISFKGEVKIADFGMAKQISESTGSYLGTIAYMAPERIRGENYSYKSDVLSFGIILYQCAIGYLPIANKSEASQNTIPDYWTLVDEFQKDYQIIDLSNNYSQDFQQFLKLCLEVQVDKRADIRELANHPWIQRIKKDKLPNPPFLDWIKQNVAKNDSQ